MKPRPGALASNWVSRGAWLLGWAMAGLPVGAARAEPAWFPPHVKRRCEDLYYLLRPELSYLTGRHSPLLVHRIWRGRRAQEQVEERLARPMEEAGRPVKFVDPARVQIAPSRTAAKAEVPFLEEAHDFFPAPWSLTREAFGSLGWSSFAELGRELKDRRGRLWRVMEPEYWDPGGKNSTLRGYHLVRVSGPRRTLFVSREDFVPAERLSMAELSATITKANGTRHRILIYVPHEHHPTARVPSEQEIRTLLSSLPEVTLAAAKKIYFPGLSAMPDSFSIRKGVPNAPIAGVHYGRGRFAIYELSEARPGWRREVLWHEHAHAISDYLWRHIEPKDAWERAMHADGLSISAYADIDLEEDFAMTVELYLRHAAGAEDGIAPRATIYPHRYALLDQLFDEQLGGLDGAFWSGLASYHAFRRRPYVIYLLPAAGGLVALGYGLGELDDLFDRKFNALLPSASPSP